MLNEQAHINDFPWLAQAWQQWQARLQNNDISNAILYQAAQGSQIELLVNELASVIQCSNDNQAKCDLCHHCELTSKGHHPDIHWVVPEQAGKAIGVEQIRQVNKVALESSQMGGKRIIIISPADAMNEAAANALLKTLETPPPTCIFILISHDKASLLPTIVSRCQQWQLPIMDENELLQWLKGHLNQDHLSQDKIQKLMAGAYWPSIALYKNAPIKALEFIEQDKAQAFEELTTCLYQVLEQNNLSLSNIQKQFKTDTIEKLDWLLLILSMVQKSHFGIDLKQAKPAIEPLAKQVSYDKAHQQYQALVSLRHTLTQSTGLNSDLLIIDWFLQFQSTQR